ncbi:hypothetical protein EOD42_16665 [Rhodovarius crocodyli]|uniref:Uncharacterized protein n=1 Tax=Rhodovarius crocodyli TaxID=1979269 RepID=A0A437MC49_9PROT|nr:hypothetical protein [Rhodovarius crocodyli]RVT95217.1 hypothetical protein EOD42_16665 [Rhodovarius crocodyli]
MASVGQPIIVPSPRGFWFFGHLTEHGVQMSIENFLDLQHARRWCQGQGIRALYEIDGARMSTDAATLLEATALGIEPQNRRGLKNLILCGMAEKSRAEGKLTITLTEKGRATAAALGVSA